MQTQPVYDDDLPPPEIYSQMNRNYGQAVYKHTWVQPESHPLLARMHDRRVRLQDWVQMHLRRRATGAEA